MTKHYLMSKFKSTGTAYLLWLLLGCHYAYLGKWGLQILYWFCIIIGPFLLFIPWIWCMIDLFLIPGKVSRYNLKISTQIADIEKKEKDEEFQKNLMMAEAIKNK